jgi:hypothetical protein
MADKEVVVRNLLLLMLLLPGSAHAQLVRGVVRADGETTAIEAASVALLDAEGVVRDSAVTDSAGRFVLSAGRAGQYALRAAHIAYTTVERPLELSQGFEVRVELRMAPHAIALEPLIITSRRAVPLEYVGFFRRSRSGMGRFLTRQDIERRQPIRMTDLFQTMPRIRFRNPVRNVGPPTLVMSAGAGRDCEPTIFVNGSPGMGARDLDTILPSEIEGIEIYSSAAFTPPEYQRHTGCGAILLWLRTDREGGLFTWTRVFMGIALFAGLLLLGSI